MAKEEKWKVILEILASFLNSIVHYFVKAQPQPAS